MAHKASASAFLTESGAQESLSRMAQAVFFDDQRRGSAQERRKKPIHEIPNSLQFFYLNPRVGLTNKEKSNMKALLASHLDNLPNLDDDDVTPTAPIAPSEADKTVLFSDVEQRETDVEVEEHDWDDLRKLFTGARMASTSIASQLDHAMSVLSMIEKKVRVSHRLEYLLSLRFQSLIEKVELPLRLWQTDAAFFEQRKSAMEVRKRRKQGHSKERLRSSQIVTNKSGSDSEDQLAEKRNSERLTSSQSRMRASKDLGDRRMSAIQSKRSPLRGRTAYRPDSIAESESERSAAYLRQTVRFVLSSSEAAAKGWIVTDDVDQREQFITTMEWCVHRILFSKRVDKQNAYAVVQHVDDPPMKAEAFKLLHSVASKALLTRNSPSGVLEKATEQALESLLTPKAPEMSQLESQRPTQLVLLADRTCTVYYPSGRVCAVRSACTHVSAGDSNSSSSSLNAMQPQTLGEKPLPASFFTTVFADTEEPCILAAFQPNGNGACFRPADATGKSFTWLLLADEGYSFFDETGNLQKTLRWPSTPSARLPGTITLHLSATIAFRCDARNDVSITLYAPQNREVMINLDVAPSASACSASNDNEVLYSNFKWKSKTARDLVSHMLAAQAQAQSKNKRKAGRAGDKTARPESSFVQEGFQEALERLGKQCKRRISDWLVACREVIVKTNERVDSAITEQQFKSQLTETEIFAGRGGGDGRLPRSFTMPELKSRSGRVSPRSNTPYSQFMRSLELSDGSTFIYTPCPVLTRVQMQVTSAPHNFTLPSFNCHCSKHRITQVTDVEFETFLRHCVPERQLVIVIVSSSSVDTSQSLDCNLSVPATYRVLDAIFREANSTRTRPCFDGVNDKYRIVEYDMLSAANNSSYGQPLLLRRHNVVPGMVLIYQNGKLLFCDHMFNGYGHSRKDFQMQIQKTLRDAGIGLTLPNDYKFVPKLKTVGPIDRYGSGTIAASPSTSTAAKSVDVATLSKSASYSNFSPSSYRVHRSMTVGPSKMRGTMKSSQIDINFLSENLA